MKKDKSKRRKNRKKRKLIKARLRKDAYRKWVPPTDANCTVHVGFNSKGNCIVDCLTTEKQIQFLKSKNTMLHRNGILYHVDDVIVETRKPVSLSQHRKEYETFFLPFLMSLQENKTMLHSEVLKSNIQELYETDIQQCNLLEFIRLDRKMRYDKKTPMADFPPVAIATIEDDNIVRLEFYRGHCQLEKLIDMRSVEYRDKDLPDNLKDNSKYDVIQNEYWTVSMSGLKPSEFRDLVDLAHEALLCDYCKISFVGDNKNPKAA